MVDDDDFEEMETVDLLDNSLTVTNFSNSGCVVRCVRLHMHTFTHTDNVVRAMIHAHEK